MGASRESVTSNKSSECILDALKSANVFTPVGSRGRDPGQEQGQSIKKTDRRNLVRGSKPP